MKRESHIFAIVMILFLMISSVLAGQTPTVAYSDVPESQFVAGTDGVYVDVFTIEYQAVQPSIVYGELTNIEGNYLVPGSADIGDSVFSTNYDVSVLQLPTYMVVTESRNHKTYTNSGEMTSEAVKGRRYILPET